MEAVRMARPLAVSNSDRRAPSKARPTVSPVTDRDVAGRRAFSGAVAVVDGDDLRRAEILGAEDRPRKAPESVEADMLGADAEGELASGASSRELGHRDRAAVDADALAPRCRRGPNGEEVHRRGADEVGDEHARRAGRRSPAACRTARCTPWFITAILSPIGMASSWSWVT